MKLVSLKWLEPIENSVLRKWIPFINNQLVNQFEKNMDRPFDYYGSYLVLNKISSYNRNIENIWYTIFFISFYRNNNPQDYIKGKIKLFYDADNLTWHHMSNNLNVICEWEEVNFSKPYKLFPNKPVNVISNLLDYQIVNNSIFFTISEIDESQLKNIFEKTKVFIGLKPFVGINQLSITENLLSLISFNFNDNIGKINVHFDFKDDVCFGHFLYLINELNSLLNKYVLNEAK